MIPEILSIEVPNIVSDGITIAIVGYVIVFSALVVLYFVFTYLSKLINYNIRQKLIKSGKLKQAEKVERISGDVSAAISLALYLNQLHDEESNVITIKRISKSYSPWSSKIYGMRRR
ncbi:MAG: OadG family protein [Bacteroidales bacterium]|nr:OadG family protein [Bacteroidales bacterium]